MGYKIKMFSKTKARGFWFEDVKRGAERPSLRRRLSDERRSGIHQGGGAAWLRQTWWVGVDIGRRLRQQPERAGRVTDRGALAAQEGEDEMQRSDGAVGGQRAACKGAVRRPRGNHFSPPSLPEGRGTLDPSRGGASSKKIRMASASPILLIVLEGAD